MQKHLKRHILRSGHNFEKNLTLHDRTMCISAFPTKEAYGN